MDNVSNKLSQQIRKKALELKRLEGAICASLPLDCHDHFHVSAIRDRQLIVLTDSPVWQTRLRMYSHSMLEAVEQHTGIKLAQVKIRLSPPRRKPPTIEPVPRVLSAQSAQLIEQTAQCISDDALQSALLRLSRKAGQKNKKP